jgi:hypothetical protein
MERSFSAAQTTDRLCGIMLKYSESSIPFHGRMTNNSNSNHTLSVIAIIIGVMGIFATVVAFAFVFSPPTLEPTPTTTIPTSSPSNGYEPEMIPLTTNTPGRTQAETVAPSNTPFPTRTPFVLPTIVPTSQLLQLPDLTVTGLSEPVCVPDRPGTILEFTFYVRNIGRASTRSFGPFDVGVYLLLGEVRYGLDEWANEFKGVIGASNLEVSNLNPNDDLKFTVVIDLRGNKNFGVEVTANSGETPIREADTTNNTLIEYFSAYCY